MKSSAVVLLGGICFAIVAPAVADDGAPPHGANVASSWGVGPTLVPASELGHRFGLRAAANWDAKGEPKKAFAPFWALHAEAQYLLVNSSVRIPDATEVRATGALSLSIFKPPKKPPKDFPIESEVWDGGGFNAGAVALGGTAAYEASADRQEQNVTLGFEARYVLNGRGWQQLVPSVYGRFEWVDPVSSQAQDAAGVPLDFPPHWQWSVHAHWGPRFDFISERLQDLRLLADVKAFKARGLEEALIEEGWESGTYLAATLRYERVFVLKSPVALSAVFCRLSTGQQPTDSVGRDAFTVGVELSLR